MMEDKNSWNELIFYHINARSEWLSSLIWRNRQKIEGDTTEDKNDDNAGKKKKVNLDSSDKGMIDWFDERQKNFKKLIKFKTYLLTFSLISLCFKSQVCFEVK